MVDNPFMSDVSFVVEGKQLKSHKLILKWRCKDLYEKVAEISQLKIENVNFDVFVEFMKFIYAAELPSKNNLAIVKLLAEQYKLPTLINICDLYGGIPETDKELRISAQSELESQMLAGIEDKESLDATFQLEDGIVQSHKLILSTRSDFFRSLFFSGMKESLENIITIQSVPCSAFRSLAEYLYSGNAETLTPDDAITLICTSSHLLDERLKKIAENTVRLGLEIENVVYLYNLASSFEATTLKDFCFQFMRKNFAKVSASSTFKDLNIEVAKQLYIEFDPSNIKIFEQRRKIEELNATNTNNNISNSQTQSHSHHRKNRKEKHEEEPPKPLKTGGECNVCSKKCSSICSGCGKVFYCGPEHQKQDWKSHKSNCKKATTHK